MRHLSAALVALSTLACSDRSQSASTGDRHGEATAAVDYDAALAALDRELEQARRLAADRAGWADHELVAKLAMRRARLSGSFDDWRAAQLALADAAAIAPEGGGPRLTQVRLDLALHRLDEAERGIEAIATSAVSTRALERDLELARAELAAQRGQLDAADAAFTRAAELGLDPRALAPRRALLARRRGAWNEARDAFIGLARTQEGQPRAWFLLQAGLVEWTRGEAAAALVLYDEARSALPGWWLVDEHRAEALAALGRTGEAEALYRAVIERTQNPEFMDALAELLADRGAASEAESWQTRARAGHEARMHRLPAAARAHALDHLVSFEPTAPATLAEVAAAARAVPHEDNLIRLAHVLLAHGQPAEARAAVERARASGATSPELDDLAKTTNFE